MLGNTNDQDIQIYYYNAIEEEISVERVEG